MTRRRQHIDTTTGDMVYNVHHAFDYGGYTMTDTSQPIGNRSVSIGGNVSGSVLQTGDHNTASVHYQHAALPAPEQVDMRTELTALREALAQLASPDRRKIDNALSDAEDELTKPQPDKQEVGKALERALDYAKKAEGFTRAVETFKPHIINAAAWLGENWHTLLNAVGLAS